MLAALALVAAASVQSADQPAAPEWPEFPAFLWRLKHRDEEPPAALVRGIGGVDVKRDRDAAWVLTSDLAHYLGHAPGRDDLHLDADDPAWREPWDAWVAAGQARGSGESAQHLIRTPCLTDPETRARIDATLAATLERHASLQPLFASLGDEVSMTPSQGVPWDGCRSETCRAAWTALGGDTMPTTDEVRRAWTRGDTSALGAWLALRRFHRGVVEDEILRSAEHARSARPELPLGLLGTIGATPFGGVDLARVLPELEVVECYVDGDARADVETLRTLPRARELWSLRTVFAAEDSAAGAAWQVSEHFVRGGDGVVIWCDADLAERPEHTAEIRRALAEVRALRSENRYLPRPAGAAVLRDDDSRALAFLEEARLDGTTWPNRFPSYQRENGLVERAVEGWLRIFEDSGLHPGVVRFGTLDPERFPVVVLPHVRVADASDENLLDDFLSGGGMLLVEGALGTHDRDGRRAPGRSTMAERLADAFPGRVHEVSAGDYLDRRLDLSAARRARFLPEPARAALAAAGHAPIPIQSADGTPWLTTRMSRTHDGKAELVIAAIPNLTSPAERARLRDSRVAPPEPPAGMRIRWIQPSAANVARDGDVVVPAGSALVFALAPAD